MFKKILIANRGEIACRVAATARRLGVRTVAVYSDVDAHAKHVLACDEAVHIGGNAPKESYLRGERIIAAAKDKGAQAIHPGYGFLSENEEFAQACADAGLVFIGPPPSAIQAMGLKAQSKVLMGQAGVPLVPGYHGVDQNPALLHREAVRIGFPVLIKASAGGGGKGMRIVTKADEFAAALGSCQREARSSFGDDAVLIERYVTRPRHIEIQVFADSFGDCVYLFERDCSVQRRHQKVLEEAPAPGISEARRREMGAAAVAAAKAVGYVGAGTVEFIAEPVDGAADGDLRFYFMEMNTRLQVEHPVTEAITGLDLVDWQLRIASGERLPLRQEQLQRRGHAIEARICAENPDANFLPATGTLAVYRTPACCEFERADEQNALRIDAGVREGDAISPYYDSMIAKLIVWGETRAQALARLDVALAGTHIVGLHNNVAFLRRVAASASFATADLDTASERPSSMSCRCAPKSPPRAWWRMRWRWNAPTRTPTPGHAATPGACTALRCAVSSSRSTPRSAPSFWSAITPARNGWCAEERVGRSRQLRAARTDTTSCLPARAGRSRCTPTGNDSPSTRPPARRCCNNTTRLRTPPTAPSKAAA
jgi:3-methylcrotonyl-CoA carboxylase alpha subunit